MTISEDSALGVRIENHREVRVDTVQQAIQYVSQVIRVRTSGFFESIILMLLHFCDPTALTSFLNS